MAGRQLALLAAVLALCGWLLPEFYVAILAYVGLYGLTALGVVLLTGVTGVTSFGQAAFVGISAYTTALATARYGLSPWTGLALALATVLALAGLLGSVTLRLSGHYLPLGTIAWGLSAYLIFGNLEELGGHTGLGGIPPVAIGPYSIETTRSFYGLIWAFALGAALLVSNMLESRVGRAMRSLKNARDTARSFGIDVGRTRLVAFLYAAALASVSGWLYAHMLRFVNPSPFSLTMGIEYLFMAVVGGSGHVWGAFLGAGLITIMKEVLQGSLPRLVGQAGSFETVVFGALVIALLQINRDGGLAILQRRPRTSSDPAGVAARRIDPLPERSRSRSEPGRPLLRVDGVTKRFGGLTALNGLGFDVGQGEIVALIGPNGAGKSTMFDVLTGFAGPDAGGIFVRGEAITRMTPQGAVALGLARTFQHVQLVPELTVLGNTMLGAHIRGRASSLQSALGLSGLEERQIRAEAVRHLARVGLADRLHVRATDLALGQQRLVEVARALCSDPELLLLDEPAAGLRHKEKDELARLLHELRAEGLSILLVEHDIGFVMDLSDRVVVVNFGEKLAEGTPGAVRADPRVVEAYLGAAA